MSAHSPHGLCESIPFCHAAKCGASGRVIPVATIISSLIDWHRVHRLMLITLVVELGIERSKENKNWGKGR
jgi:hypothetical protein